MRRCVPVLLLLFACAQHDPATSPGKQKKGPNPDRDGDGIVDVKDRCPDEPEDYDGFQDDDGCYDRDNDNDGVPDVEDECMNNPMGPKPDPKHRGCPSSG